MALARDITVIGASAGGVTAVRDLVRSRPPGHPAAVFAGVHAASVSPAPLHEVLGRASSLPVRRTARSFGAQARTAAAHAEVLRGRLARAAHAGPAEPEARAATAA